MSDVRTDDNVLHGSATARLRIGSREYVNFVGSGYLALSRVPQIRAAALRALQGGAPFVRQIPRALGFVDPRIEDAEKAAAAWLGRETSLYFASGYLIGMVGLANAAQSFDVIFIDENAHYCLQDAVTLSGLPRFTYAHCDSENLDNLLRQHVGPNQRPLIVTDGAFATTGRIPPLAEYAAACAAYGGRFFIDESHSFGVVGQQGRGSAELCGIEHIAMTGATLSKAFCAQGAIVACAAATAARLRLAPVMRGASAGSPISAAAAAASLTYASQHPELRQHLSAMTAYLRNRLRQIGLDVIDSPAPIVSFQWGDHADMQALRQRLLGRGVHVYHSTSYIGVGAQGMIRCAVFADHSKEDIDSLVAGLG